MAPRLSAAGADSCVPRSAPVGVVTEEGRRGEAGGGGGGHTEGAAAATAAAGPSISGFYHQPS